MPDRKINSVLVIGLGLISGSLVKLFKQKDQELIIDVVARRQETLDQANKLIRNGYSSLDQLSNIEHDLVLIGLPMQKTIEYFSLLKDKLSPNTIVTDISSVKKAINNEAAPIKDNFVGGHPLAGSDKSGFENSAAEIMQGARYILTNDNDQYKRALLKSFLNKMGFNVLEMTAEEHDHQIAAISHLPYMAAVSLLNSIGKDDLQLAASGLASTSRVAGSPVLWGQEIARYNRDELLIWLDSYLEQIKLLKGKIIANENLSELLNKARDKRLNL
jgi:prephenate dehydrogenase